ncbi:MAG: hypothetical protein FD145_417 [Candidatus Saganbacteria bacterium]|uniref:Transglycosylase SLT domain-containing protein n=1 Tax=Candidatus Saganbacteria bacterium TaxID=2575572 RepID=A0A833L206_UNCSA|nr:MAG: hypothetical protein FD145_417 [Candidatus Saganbacteria bacterium]
MCTYSDKSYFARKLIIPTNPEPLSDPVMVWEFVELSSISLSSLSQLQTHFRADLQFSLMILFISYDKIYLMTKKQISLIILSPKNNDFFSLESSLPIKATPIILKAQVLKNSIDMPISFINWRVKLVWCGTYQTYQTNTNISGNAATIQSFTGGKLYIRASTIIDKKEYSSLNKAVIIANNPTRELLKKTLPSDILKAIAWQESSWRQFDAKGNPLKNPSSSMIGIMQISERWWGNEKSSIKSNDFNKMAWNWSYNIQAAKEILEYYFQRVINKFPNETEESKWNRTVKAYHVGESSINTKESADDFWYVKKIRSHIKEKSWEK